MHSNALRHMDTFAWIYTHVLSQIVNMHPNACMHTYGCIDIHMPRHLVHAYADICIHTYTYAYIFKHMYTNECVRAYVCVYTCISAQGRWEGHPEYLTPPLGGEGGGRWPWALMHIYIHTLNVFIQTWKCVCAHVHIMDPVNLSIQAVWYKFVRFVT